MSPALVARSLPLLLALLSAGAGCAGRGPEEPVPMDEGEDAAAAAGRGGGRGTADAASGTGGRTGGDAAASEDRPTMSDGRPAPALGPIVISEIMYHPVLDEGAEERHEFVELHNRGPAPISLAKWRLVGGAQLEFPAGTTIAAGQYLVVAKDRMALLALGKYALAPGAVVGDFAGALENGGGKVTLVDEAGQTVDGVEYDDSFPWPIGADALGAADAWLREPARPLAAHRYLGRSLERVSFDVSAREPANWVASPLDGATPGRKNAAAGAVLPIVEALAVAAEGGSGPARPDRKTTVRVTFSPGGEVAAPALEWFVDAVERTDEPAATLPLTRVGPLYEATLPPQAANAILRYRVVGDRGKGVEVISPRPSDPAAWHAAFVEPEAKAPARTHHLFIAPADWGRLWDNIRPGRVPSGQCKPSASWNGTVPAVFAHGGAVYDVQIRYVGSYIHRADGETIPTWPHPAPTSGPKPLRVLSFKVSFPRWQRFEGQSSVTLNKMWQTCPGVEWHVEGALMRAAGVPAPRVRFARVNVNGGYYQYMVEIERVGDDFLERAFKSKKVGDLFKNDGMVFGDSGPWGPGDGRLLAASCGFNVADRYAYTYPRETHAWKGKSEPVQALLEGLAAARAKGGAELRAFLGKTFDVEAVLSYIAVKNWSGAWDDAMHNHFLYLRPDGRWMLLPWDFDQDFGIASANDGNARRTPASSLYLGEEGVAENKLGWNHIKDAFLKAYRPEYHQRLLALGKTTLAPEHVLGVIDEGAGMFSLADYAQIPAKPACDPRARMEAIRNWARERHAVVQQRIGGM